ncbi:hypothetical protein MRX96_020584 [Rhipicephalus microplus]
MTQTDGHADVRRYWRLQDTYLPTLQPMFYCSGIVVYGYGVRANGEVVWKIPDGGWLYPCLESHEERRPAVAPWKPCARVRCGGRSARRQRQIVRGRWQQPGLLRSEIWGATVMEHLDAMEGSKCGLGLSGRLVQPGQGTPRTFSITWCGH